MESIKLSVGVISQDEMKLETVGCLIYALNQVSCPVKLNFHKGTYVQELRNDTVKTAREEGATHLMFVDTDLVFPADGIKKLLEADKDIIGGVYNMKSIPPVTTLKLLGEDGKRMEKKDFEMPKEIFKCHAIPTGFMLIKLDAIKDMEYPFSFDRENGELIGEDVYFCQEAQKLGAEVWCDPTIQIGHIGNYIY